MKRFLFCAGILALAASCTESEFDSASVQNGQTKGITFQAVEGNDAVTRGGFIPGEGSFVPFWYAEKDQIAIWGTQIAAADGVTSDLNNATDDFVKTAMATYKATQSASLGVFTGKGENNVLDFGSGSDESNPSKFFALYPADLATTLPKTNVFSVDLSSVTLATQTQKDLMGDGIYDNVVKWSATTAYKVNPYDAVGEKINLNFNRVLSGMVFSTLNADKYTKGENSLFGKLKKITLTAEGDAESQNVSNLTLGSGAKFTVDLTNIAEPAAELTKGSDATASIELTLGGAEGLEWNDDAKAFMVIAPVDGRAADGKTLITETVTAKYEFANITLTDKIETNKNWVAGKFYAYKDLDIDKFNYLVTEKSTSVKNDRALIINKGNLSDIFDGTDVTWNSTKVAATEFSNIICNVELTAEELKSLNTFTNATSITLAKNTEIPAEAFSSLSKLQTIDMPLVTTIAEDAFANELALDSLKLGSYEFNNDNVNKKLLCNETKAKLIILDMSGVTTMARDFGETSFDLNDFEKLQEVRVKEGVKLSENAFKGCSALKTVTNAVELASGAFDGCKLLENININGTVIPDNAFNNCAALTSILVNGKPLVPTAVGVSAFEGTKNIAHMDLSNVTTLGASAFKKSGLTAPSESDGILKVGATSIPESAFEGTKVAMIQFTAATSFGVNIFNGCTTLQQVKFDKTFEIQEDDMPGTIDGWENTFGTAGNVTLYVAAGQKYVSGRNLTLPYKEGNANVITFKSIKD